MLGLLFGLDFRGEYLLRGQALGVIQRVAEKGFQGYLAFIVTDLAAFIRQLFLSNRSADH